MIKWLLASLTLLLGTNAICEYSMEYQVPENQNPEVTLLPYLYFPLTAFA